LTKKEIDVRKNTTEPLAEMKTGFEKEIGHGCPQETAGFQR